MIVSRIYVNYRQDNTVEMSSNYLVHNIYIYINQNEAFSYLLNS